MSYRDDCMIRDAVISAIFSLGLSRYWIAQFFGIGYSQVSSYLTQHRRREFRVELRS